jgi:hypothetical protein
MMSQRRLPQPPRVASWLVDLLSPDKQAESIAGDLLEEFSELAPKSGIAFARRWYWRQTVKSIAHLIGTGFRVAPWSIVGGIVGGYLLLGYGFGLPEKVIVAVLDFRRHNVMPYYSWPQIQAHIFWLNGGILLGRLLLSLIIGCIVSMTVKGRELVVTMMLSLFWAVLCGVREVQFMQLARHYGVHSFAPLPLLVSIFGCPIMIITGGTIVRLCKQSEARRPSRA